MTQHPKVVAPQETKPAAKTTEFWFTVVFVALSVLQQAIGVFNIHDATVLKGQAFVLGLYLVARGWAKSGVPWQGDVVPGPQPQVDPVVPPGIE